MEEPITPKKYDPVSEAKKAEVEKAMQEGAERFARLFWKQYFEAKSKEQRDPPTPEGKP